MTFKKSVLWFLVIGLSLSGWIYMASNTFEEEAKNALQAIYSGKANQTYFSSDQSERLSSYFTALNESGYDSPVFTSYKPENEPTLYVLIRTKHKESDGEGIGYVVIALGENNQPSEVMLSNRVRISKDKPNF